MMVGSSSSFSSCSSSSQSFELSSIDDSTTDLSSTEDVLFDIFLRLPLKSILNLRRVSKLWLSLLSNPLFITKWRGLNKLGPWTLVYQLSNSPDNYPSVASLDTHSQFISDNSDGLSLRFIRKGNIDPVGSCNGLLLFTTARDYLSKYYVCNPLMKQTVSLPSPRLYEPCKWAIHGFLCNPSSLTSASTYKVVRIPLFSDPTTKFDVEIFSSDIGEWKIHRVSCPQEVTVSNAITSNVVHLNGVLYWIEDGNRIIAYNLNSNNNNEENDGFYDCRLIDLPKERSGSDDYFYSRCLGESEGFICYCHIDRRHMTLNVWELEENDSNGGWVWHLVHKNIEIWDILRKTGRFRYRENYVSSSVRPLAFNPCNRNMVILSFETCILAYNFRTSKSEFLQQEVDVRFPLESRVLPVVLTPKPIPLPVPSLRSTDLSRHAELSL